MRTDETPRRNPAVTPPREEPSNASGSPYRSPGIVVRRPIAEITGVRLFERMVALGDEEIALSDIERVECRIPPPEQAYIWQGPVRLVLLAIALALGTALYLRDETGLLMLCAVLLSIPIMVAAFGRKIESDLRRFFAHDGRTRFILEARGSERNIVVPFGESYKARNLARIIEKRRKRNP